MWSKGNLPNSYVELQLYPNRGSMAFETMFFFGGAYIQSYFTSLSLRGTMTAFLPFFQNLTASFTSFTHMKKTYSIDSCRCPTLQYSDHAFCFHHLLGVGGAGPNCAKPGLDEIRAPAHQVRSLAAKLGRFHLNVAIKSGFHDVLSWT